MARVLIIDDEAHLRLLYRLELKLDGYDVIEAGTGGEGLKLLEQEEIDAVVMDLRLPDMEWRQLMDEMLTRQQRLPIIINTAYEQWRHDFHSWGAEAYIMKSSDLSDLKRALARFVRHEPKLENGARRVSAPDFARLHDMRN
jgi:DNA-binding NtrC family response regulator